MCVEGRESPSFLGRLMNKLLSLLEELNIS